MTLLRTLLAATCLALIPAAAQAQALTAEQTQAIDKIVADALASTGVPSASIAVVRDGQIVLAKAYGNQGPDMKATSADARYQIASISKQFTAAAILLLEDEGKLSLDDTVAKWIPGISGGDHITIRQLLSHTAGIQDYWPQDYSFLLMEKPTTPQAIVDRWAKKPLDFEPGTAWQYSNTGYVVAGMIVEKASGQPLLKFLDQHIFKPLGMHPIDQDVATGKGFPQPTHRFALGPIRAAKPPASGWLYAAGELAMTASDLAKWDVARINRNVLTPEDWDTQETAIKLKNGFNTNYGLGVSIENRGGHRWIEHAGEAIGFLSENTVSRDDKFAVVALVNADFASAQETIAAQITDLLLPIPAPPAPAPTLDQQRDALARRIFGQLRTGTLDRSLLTDDANYYFDATAIGDYRDSLGPLGEPQSITPLGGARLRGGFVNRNYAIQYPGKKLLVITYAEAGADGKFEQFIVMPGD
jgi:CubicO group peptidase (beta-lactamase class C family)